MRSQPPIRPDLVEQIQEWERALKSGDPATRAAFAAWIRRSPEHLQVFLQHLSLHEELRGLDTERKIDLEDLLAQASGNVIPLSSAQTGRTGDLRDETHSHGRWRGAVAATVLAAALIAGLTIWHGGPAVHWEDYRTATGEQHRVALPDGSILELNTQSHVRVAYQAHRRDVELVAGEAFFNIRGNPQRPFRVHTVRAVIEDLGTAFSIYIRPDATTTVAVVEGRVALAREPTVAPFPQSSSEGNPQAPAGTDTVAFTQSTEILAGEQVEVDAVGQRIRRARINPSEAASWRQHRLWFDGASLQQVASEFNRYNTRKIEISADPALAQKRYTATWDSYDPESFIQYLQSDPTLQVQHEPGVTTVKAR